MIAIQKIGKNFIGPLRYNLKKLNYPDVNRRAELLDTNFTSMDMRQISKEVKLLRSLRPNLSRYVFNTSISFSIEDHAGLSNEKMVAIALDYLVANGFTNNQYLVFRHHDTSHQHMHLLANRIGFDGEVVSDSNNYKKSEAVLGKLEMKYGLKKEQGSKTARQRAATKGELEMVLKTGKPSDKMVLQELMKGFLGKKNLTISKLIAEGEKQGVYFLFNQALTGKAIGLCYFYDDFKIKGRSLGNGFKWAELIKKVNYEQDRDGEAISNANSRTKAKYGESSSDRQRSTGLSPNDAQLIRIDFGQPSITGEIERENRTGGERSLETGQDAVLADIASAGHEYHNDYGFTLPEISDDEAVLGKKR